MEEIQLTFSSYAKLKQRQLLIKITKIVCLCLQNILGLLSVTYKRLTHIRKISLRHVVLHLVMTTIFLSLCTIEGQTANPNGRDKYL